MGILILFRNKRFFLPDICYRVCVLVSSWSSGLRRISIHLNGWLCNRSLCNRPLCNRYLCNRYLCNRSLCRSLLRFWTSHVYQRFQLCRQTSDTYISIYILVVSHHNQSIITFGNAVNYFYLWLDKELQSTIDRTVCVNVTFNSLINNENRRTNRNRTQTPMNSTYGKPRFITE